MNVPRRDIWIYDPTGFEYQTWFTSPQSAQAHLSHIKVKNARLERFQRCDPRNMLARWFIFDLDNGDDGRKRYLFNFSTRLEAVAKKSSWTKQMASWSLPQSWLSVSVP